MQAYTAGTVLFCCLWGSMGSTLRADPLTEIEKELELLRMQRLAQVQTVPGSEIDPFTTDGCSGGMSDAWLYMAQLFPSFKARYGDQPLWQDCCVQHDRRYWYGETDDGYEKRLDADRALRRCVQEVGGTQSARLAEEHGVDPQQVQRGFTIASHLMYRAVRLGGKPCTLFSWRWGYGWPRCDWILQEE